MSSPSFSTLRGAQALAQGMASSHDFWSASDRECPLPSPCFTSLLLGTSKARSQEPFRPDVLCTGLISTLAKVPSHQAPSHSCLQHRASPVTQRGISLPSQLRSSLAPRY